MSEIILIETSTRLCSVALASDGRIRAYRESAEPHSHASLTSVFVKQVLELRPYSFSTVGVDSPDDLVKNKLGEYGEGAKGWTSEDAKGFIKVSSTALRAYYLSHKDELPND